MIFRPGAGRALAVALLQAGCADDTSEQAPPGAKAPFGEMVSYPLPSPGRSLDALQSSAGVEVMVTMELTGELRTFRFDGGWSESARLEGLQGPRAACASGDTIVVAEAGANRLSTYARTGGGFEPRASVGVDGPATQVACGDVDGDGEGDVVAIVGLGDAAMLTSFFGPSLTPGGPAVPAPQASRIRLGDVDADGDDDGIVIATSRKEVTLLRADGALAPVRTLTAAEPRSGALAPGLAAIADDGAVLLIGDPWGAAPPASVATATDLYDVWLSDFDGDGALDAATVSLATHEAFAILAVGTERQASFLYPVPRGPIALTSGDLDGSPGEDLVVLSYEQPSVAMLPGAIQR